MILDFGFWIEEARDRSRAFSIADLGLRIADLVCRGFARTAADLKE